MRALATALITITTSTALCDVISVPADYASVQDAINAAFDGDEVVLAPGTYDEHYIQLQGKAITLRSQNPEDPGVVQATILRGFQLGPVLQCVDGEGLDTVISGLTITNGKATEPSGFHGGGLEITGSSATVEKCVFRDNGGRYGGGAAVIEGVGVFTGCVFESNTADVHGAGLTVEEDSEVIVTSCEFIDNTTLNGGGAYSERSTLRFIDCAFIDNTAEYVGFEGLGGGARMGRSDAVFDGCLFEGNSARIGGGISSNQGLRLNRCVVRFNTAAVEGGGVDAVGDPFVMDHCVVVGNHSRAAGISGFGGGGLHVWNNDPVIRNSAFVSNTCERQGGAIFVQFANLVIQNSIAWDNSADAGSDQFKIDNSSTASATYCVLQSIMPGAGNTGADPLFVRMPDSGVLDPGDLHLAPGSPAIDAGDNSLIPADEFDVDDDGDTAEPVPLDLGGGDRFLDDLSSVDSGAGSAPIVDIGPYEHVQTLFPCNDADLAPPFETLDFSDVLGFLIPFGAMEPEADLAEPFGVWDFSDVLAFITAFGAGCP